MHGAAAVNALGLKHSTIFAGGGALCRDLLAYHYNESASVSGRKTGCVLVERRDYCGCGAACRQASDAAAAGMSLPMIGKLLGHSQPVTTARYAHLAVDPIRAASNLIGAEIDAAMNKRARAGLRG